MGSKIFRSSCRLWTPALLFLSSAVILDAALEPVLQLLAPNSVHSAYQLAWMTPQCLLRASSFAASQPGRQFCTAPQRALGARLAPVLAPRKRGQLQRFSMILNKPFEEPEDVAERLYRKEMRKAEEDRDEEGVQGGAGAAGEADDQREKRMFEVEMGRPLGLILKELPPYGVYVEAVSADGTAKAAGVQRGDRIVATSSTMGGAMWEKSTLEGVLAAVHSATNSLMGKGSVTIRFERDPVLASLVCFGQDEGLDTSRVELPRALISVEKARLRVQRSASETFRLTLPLPGKTILPSEEDPFTGAMPYGLRLVQARTGAGQPTVEVADVVEGGLVAESGLLRVGDRIVATQGSVGQRLWPKTTIEGVRSAFMTRLGGEIELEVERRVELGQWQDRTALDVVQSDPLDKTTYYSTLGAAASIKFANKGKTKTVLRKKGAAPPKMDAGTFTRATLATSLAVLPDEAGWDLVQEVRQFHDRRVKLWPPHVILLKPFVRGSDFPAASQLLLDAVAEFEPFELRTRLQSFKHHDKCSSVWLVPDESSLEQVRALQEACGVVFPKSNKPKKVKKLLDFSPHMTLGQFPSEAAANTFIALVEDKLGSLSFPVRDVYLLSRPDRNSSAVDQLRVPLGSPAYNTSLASAIAEYASLRKAGAALSASTTRSVLLERCSFDVTAFGKSGNVTGIDAMVANLRDNAVEIDAKLLNIVLGAYIQSGHPQRAVAVFDDLTAQASKSAGTIWVEAARSVSRNKGAAAAEAAGDEGGAEQELVPVVPSVQCYATLIKALGQARDLDRAHKVIDKMVRAGPPPTIRVINALLEACVRNDDLGAAKKLFSSLRGVRGEGSGQMLTPDTDAGVSISLQPTEVSYNIMVNAYGRAKQVNQAFKMLLEMRRGGCKPDVITYTTLIKACVSAGQLDRAVGLLEQMDELEIEPDVFTYNALLNGLAKQLRWRECKAMLGEMEAKGVQPNLLSFSYTMRACVKARRVREAQRLFYALQEKGLVPNVKVYSTLMAGFASQAMVAEAQELIQAMQRQRIRPNEYTFSSLIEAFLRAGYASEALEVLGKMGELGMETEDVVLQTQKMRALAMQGKLAAAFAEVEAIKALLKRQRKRVPTVVYNELIGVCMATEETDSGAQALQLLLDDRARANRKTFEALTRTGLQGMARAELMLDLIKQFRAAGQQPQGPLYVGALKAALDAGEPDLALLITEERKSGGFAVAKQDLRAATNLELRALNALQANSKGQWFDRPDGSKVKSGRLGSITGSAQPADWEWDSEEESRDWSANPEDRSFFAAEWW